MTLTIHGGDIYKHDIRLDFSVNVNAYGPDPAIIQAMHDAVGHVSEYPEYDASRLKRKLAATLDIDEAFITLTSGASEAFIAVTQGLRPRSGAVQAPSFYGYSYALKAAGSRIVCCDADSCAYPDAALESDAEMIFAANPNNPTGQMIGPDKLREMAREAGRQGRYLVVDECFLPLTGDEGPSLIKDLAADPGTYGHTVIVRSFTKTFAIPGIRLGYCICTDKQTNSAIRSHLPEWNLSNIAQEAGLAALDCLDTVLRQIALMNAERVRLTSKLDELGLDPVEGKANFILFKGPSDLKERLLSKGILIRDCSNFEGLGPGCFRTAVRKSEEDDELLRALGEVLTDTN